MRGGKKKKKKQIFLTKRKDVKDGKGCACVTLPLRVGAALSLPRHGYAPIRWCFPVRSGTAACLCAGVSRGRSVRVKVILCFFFFLAKRTLI